MRHLTADYYLLGNPNKLLTRGEVIATLRHRNEGYRPWRPEPVTIKDAPWRRR